MDKDAFSSMTAGHPSISVVIPSHDGAAYIHDAIRSVLRQTVLPQEIVIVDDYSHDSTLAALADLARSAPVPIRVVRLTRNSGGPAHPINIGVETATSELIAVLEQDDQMAATRIARSVAAVVALPTAGLICGRVRLHSAGDGIREDLWWDGRRQFDGLPLTCVAEGLYRAESQAAISLLLQRNFVFTNSNAVFSRATWQRVGGFDRTFRICSDLDFNLKVARIAPFAIVDEVLCNHYRRDDSLYNRNRAPERGSSPAHAEAALIRLQHALRAYGSRSDAGWNWYRQGWHMLASDCKHLRWNRGARVLRTLCAAGGISRYAAAILRRSLMSGPPGTPRPR
jgi:glycosyltransferase involved in cell wall biosynthesis